MASLDPWTRPVRAVAIGAIVILLAGCNGSSTTGTTDSASTQPSASSQPPAPSKPSPSAPDAVTSISGTSPASPISAAPTLSGTPATKAIVGQLYSFKPDANDPAGRILSFSVQNKPAWAGFSTSTGQLLGTPIGIDSGTNSNIVIGVNDGLASAALTPFAIHVMQSTRNNVTLAWTAPTENTDGSPLTDLAGYRIYYGTDPTELTNSIDINNVGVLTYVVGNLAQGTWYFAVTAINSDNAESDFSYTVDTTI